jgi:hypothetical protein
MFLTVISAVLGQSCLQTNRLCIESTFIPQNGNIQVFYPTTVIPVDINPFSMTLNIFTFNGSFSQDPCDKGIPVKSFPISPTIADAWTNVTTVTIDVPEGEYIMQLSDIDKRQCILGPNINGLFNESVRVRRVATATTTIRATPTTTTAVAPDAKQPTTSDSNSSRNLIIILSVAISAVILIVAGIIYMRHRKRNNRQRGYPNRDYPLESVVAEPPSVHVDINRSRISLGSKLSLRRYDTEGRSMEERDVESPPRMSMAVESSGSPLRANKQ